MINDLQLSGAILGILSLECQGLSLNYCHLATYCDTTSVLVWHYKLCNSKSKISGRLLWFFGLRIHACYASVIIPRHIARDHNKMSDIVSRTFKKGKYVDASSNLVAYFNHRHLPPAKNVAEVLASQLARVTHDCMSLY